MKRQDSNLFQQQMYLKAKNELYQYITKPEKPIFQQYFCPSNYFCSSRL